MARVTKQQNNLASWFQKLPEWLQEAARRLYEQKNFSSEDLSDVTELCIREAREGLRGHNSCDFFTSSFSENSDQQVRLVSISDVEGINALQSKKPLEFGKSNLTIIYGANGSGKSGYVRIIKHICNAKSPGELHPNVFSSNQNHAPKCKISFEKDGSPKEQEWLVGSGSIKDLHCVDIFDSACARLYVTDENEVSYEPSMLSFFSKLAEICESVASKIKDREAQLLSKKPSMPLTYSSTEAFTWYSSLKAETKGTEIEKYCSWSDDDEKNLNTLTNRLAEQNPSETSKRLFNQKKYVDSISSDIQTKLSQLSNENIQKIIGLKNNSLSKQKVAKEVAEKIFQDSKLDGIGNESWKLLWKHAKEYSESHAYPKKLFPHVDEGALCVLCQQILSDEGKQRLISFEDYVKDKVNKEVAETEKVYSKSVSEIQVAAHEDLKYKLDASGLDESISNSIQELFDIFRQRLDKIARIKNIEDLNVIPETNSLLESLQKKSSKLNDDVLKYQQDAVSSNRQELNKKQLQLQSKKWLSQNKRSVEDEIQRLMKVSQLQKAKQLTNTAALSRKKGELAEELITEAFVKRFDNNLSVFGASKIKVKMVKIRTDKGKVLHQLKLKENSKVSIDEVLSEGEYRIVSLAAFLADVEASCASVPFVFDDPITSLDQDYEEAVVMQLIEIAKRRQVIVFTHRISLLVMLQDYAKKSSINKSVICLRQEDWGTGDPGSTPIFAQKPGEALNSLLNERLPKAKKALCKLGQEVYDSMAKSLCSDFRIILEKLIEIELLADVVQRYRRAVNTQGKINKLALIQEEDCALFENLMTEYSRYEHSQPYEAPVSMPMPDKVQKDIESIKTWLETFKVRKK